MASYTVVEFFELRVNYTHSRYKEFVRFCGSKVYHFATANMRNMVASDVIEHAPPEFEIDIQCRDMVFRLDARTGKQIIEEVRYDREQEYRT